MRNYLFELLFPSLLIDYNHYKQLASRFDFVCEKNQTETGKLMDKNEDLANYITILSKENAKLHDEVKHHEIIVEIYKKSIIPKEIKYYECGYCEFVTQLPAHFCPACNKDNTGKTKEDYKK